ncbi:hypothetical protein BDZ45DRAFT_51481 [Acephala macrosclerotiorum]|nr:hypothetical protein BDZ45DRAFT_51481 [Acephala macrosclerotiorum]
MMFAPLIPLCKIALHKILIRKVVVSLPFHVLVMLFLSIVSARNTRNLFLYVESSDLETLISRQNFSPISMSGSNARFFLRREVTIRSHSRIEHSPNTRLLVIVLRYFPCKSL